MKQFDIRRLKGSENSFGVKDIFLYVVSVEYPHTTPTLVDISRLRRLVCRMCRCRISSRNTSSTPRVKINAWNFYFPSFIQRLNRWVMAAMAIPSNTFYNLTYNINCTTNIANTESFQQNIGKSLS